MDLSSYDFVDLGCSTGGSLKYGQKILGGERGLGIDIDPRKVERTRQQGFDAEVMDATQLAHQPDSVSFVTMIHFLEHLPNLDLAAKCIESAIIAAEDYVLFRQPWFDSDAQLAEVDCKFFWSDWSGHTLHLGVGDIAGILTEHARGMDWAIFGYKQVLSSSDPNVVPMSSKRNRHHYDPETDEPKRYKVLEPVGFHEALTVVNKSGRFSTDELVAKHRDTVPLMRSA